MPEHAGDFPFFDSEVQRQEVGKYSSDAMLDMMDYVYDHFDAFRLLLEASHGTKFQHFIDGLVSMEEEYTWKWMEVTGSCLKQERKLTAELYNMMGEYHTRTNFRKIDKVAVWEFYVFQ